MPIGLQGFQKGNNFNLGRECSEETRQKIRVKLLGNKNGRGCRGNPWTDEHRKNLSLALLGKTLEEMGHKPNCPCCICKAKRGETKGKKNSFFNKHHTEQNKINWSLDAGGTGIPHEFSEYPFEFSEKLKEKIRKRDKDKCQKCGLTKKEHLEKYGSNIEVHHIDYNKKNCKETNLITLCKECNIQANKNKKYWIIYFTGITR